MQRCDLTRHVIFDLDGTLVDSCAICVDILSEILVERRSDHVIDPLVAREFMSRGGLEMVSALLGPACGNPLVELADFRARYHQRRTPAETVFPGVAEGLQKIRDAGFTLSICSNKPQGLCEKVLRDTGLAGHFAVIVGGQPGLRAKPAPDLLRAVLDQLDACPLECMFVGDSELDHEIALNAAMPFHFVTYGYASPDWAPSGCTTFDRFNDLTDVILAQHVHA